MIIWSVSQTAQSYHPMMDTKIEIGQENISFEMESKQEDNAVT